MQLFQLCVLIIALTIEQTAVSVIYLVLTQMFL